MSQTTYGNPPKYIAGQNADSGFKDDASSYNAEASAPIRFGIFVKRGTSGLGSKVLAAVTDKPFGVSVYSNGYDRLSDIDDTTGGVKSGLKLSVRRKGRVAVQVEGTIVPGDRPHVRAVSGAGGTVLGKARADAVAGETIDATNLGEFVSANENGFAVLEIDMTSQPQGVLSVGTPVITAAAEGGDARAVSVQMPTAARHHVTWWLADAANGAPSADPPSGGTAVTTGVALKEHTAEVFGEAVTDAAGLLVLTLTEAGADSWFLMVAVQGTTFASAEIAFT